MFATMSVKTGCSAFQAGPQTRPSRRRLAVTQATSDPLMQKPVARPSPPPVEAPSSSAPAPAAPAAPAAAPPAASMSGASGVTLEYQRQQAKEMQKYFKSLKYNEAVDKAKVFGWTKKNEITNGRWVMMGFFIGLLTELATGVDFPNQLKMMASFLGLADIE